MACAARTMAALGGICCAAFLFSPIQIGMLALAAAACALAMPRRRMAAIEVLAGLAFMAFMFGPAGAGGFALMHALGAAPLLVSAPRARSIFALTVTTALAATLSVCAATFLSEMAPTRWAPFAPMAPAFMLAAPALVVRRLGRATGGPVRAQARRLNALGPLLVALVVGAGVDGLHGAAVGWAGAQLAIPLTTLLRERHRASLAPLALGVLAAGFVATLATGAALGFAGGAPLAAAPAMMVGVIVFTLALRVHAPAAARHLERGLARLIPNVTVDRGPSRTPDAAT